MADFTQLEAIIHGLHDKLISQQEEINRLRIELVNAKFDAIDAKSTRTRSLGDR